MGMIAYLLLGALGLWLLGGISALVMRRAPRLANGCGAGSAVVGALLGTGGALTSALGGKTIVLACGWSIPFGSARLELDALSAFFWLPVLLLGALGAVYGARYLGQDTARHFGVHWFSYNLLLASMSLALLASNAFWFLLAWEVMSLASFVLVVHDGRSAGARYAGWVYLVATQLGTLPLVVLFALLSDGERSLDFADLSASCAGAAGRPGLLFLLALLGFGAKAGFLPLHVWLPEAHPAAPSHVSSLMSGAMLKTGIYGLFRILSILLRPGHTPPFWWGSLLVLLGAASGIFGVLLALGQHDLKRLLAYHSVENLGIIALGLGLGLVGSSARLPTVVVLGYGGALLHVLNHACFKGLLFFGAGNVLRATGTRELEHLGGLAKRMPWTSLGFLVGSVAISGVPPLNGFVSEFLLFLAAYRGITVAVPQVVVPAAATLGALGLIGGLAVACFTKAFGVIFLGEPRTSHAEQAQEVAWGMRWPPLLLGLSCIAIGMGGPWVVKWLTASVAAASGLDRVAVMQAFDEFAQSLKSLTLAGIIWLGVTTLLALLRRGLLSRRIVTRAPTWDCGFALASPRMQYTASSFAQPLTDLFQPVLRTRRKIQVPAGLFAGPSSLATESLDPVAENLYRPVFAGLAWLAGKLRGLQQGSVHRYVLVVLVTLLVLLIAGLS